jgi:hypothetical protein
MKVNLPDRDSNLIFYQDELKYYDRTNFTYYGNLSSCTEEIGLTHLIGSDGNIFGSINAGGNAYEIIDLGGEKNVLFRVDIKGDKRTCFDTNSSGFKAPDIISETRAGNQCPVKILVLYTDKAAAIADPNQKARLGIDDLNKIMFNSFPKFLPFIDLMNPIKFELAGVVRVNDFETTNPITTLNACYNSNFENLRTIYHADLVIVFTKGNYSVLSNGVNIPISGSSSLNNFGNPLFGAYGLVEIDGAISGFTFAHEVAHNFGCKHNGDTHLNPFDAQGKLVNAVVGSTWFGLFNKIKLVRTVVTVETIQNTEVIMHFSNPKVSFKKGETGEEGISNNAKQLTALGCFVSNYRLDPPALTLQITGPTSGKNFDPNTWCASVSNCTGTITYKWEASIDGYNYTTYANTAQCLTGSLPFQQDLYLRVTATCSDGRKITDFIWVENKNKHCIHCIIQDPCGENTSSYISKSNDEVNYTITPNPVNSTLEFDFYENDNCKSKIEIIDMFGKVINTVSIETFKGNNKKNIDVSNITKGSF